MLVEGSGEVHVEQLLVVDGEGHHPASETEVAEVVGVNIGVAVGLKCGTWEEGGREGGGLRVGTRWEEESGEGGKGARKGKRGVVGREYSRPSLC